MPRFRALPRASRALLVRLVTRNRTMFRRSRLNYAEIGDTAAAAAPLVQLDWVDEAPDLDVEQLQGLLTKAELLDNFPIVRPLRARKKPELVAVLRAQSPGSQPFHEWCKQTSDRVYRLNVAALCERFRLMFFGNFHQDWSEFVLADLGVLTYEKVPAALQSPAFGSRGHIDTFERLYQCRQQLESGPALAAVAERMPPPIDDCDWLEDRRQKLLYQIATGHEKSGDSSAALAVLAECSHRGARMRRIRLHERAHAWATARDLCLEALQKPENEAERQQLHRVLPRLNRKLGIGGATAIEPRRVPSFELLVAAPTEDCAVELRGARASGTGRGRQRGSLCRERAGQRAVWAAVLEGDLRADRGCVLSRFSIWARRSLERPILSAPTPRICRMLCGVGIRSV